MTERTLVDYAKDGAYITVGAGVLAFQRAQVARRELQDRLGIDGSPELWTTLTDAGQSGVDNVRDALKSIGDIDQVKTLDARMAELEARLDEVLDQVSERLPEQAKSALDNLRTTSKENNEQLRSLLGIERAAK